MRDKMSALVHERQDEVCEALSSLGDGTFQEDTWERDEGGGGRTRVLEGGDVFERAGVNVSVVNGELSDRAAREMGGGQEVDDRSFWAAGLSLVIHPQNPYIPTFHANYRYFERGGGTEPGSWWFGGGADLTPYYRIEEDFRHFHRTLKDVCDRHDTDFYPEFKPWCDEYFYLDHRSEARGIGGIFFDNLNRHEPDELFEFVSDASDQIVDSFVPIVRRRKDREYGDQQREWQRIRRGRYVEFNLVYDRGTKFGLRTDGRTESILVSMPPVANWRYDHSPEPGSPEAQLQAVLEEPREWIDT
jgi:coproporphyrinogen III oxidase